jgi:hypothetical protein
VSMAHGRRQVRSLLRSIGLPPFMRRSSSFTRLKHLVGFHFTLKSVARLHLSPPFKFSSIISFLFSPRRVRGEDLIFREVDYGFL